MEAVGVGFSIVIWILAFNTYLLYALRKKQTAQYQELINRLEMLNDAQETGDK